MGLGLGLELGLGLGLGSGLGCQPIPARQQRESVQLAGCLLHDAHARRHAQTVASVAAPAVASVAAPLGLVWEEECADGAPKGCSKEV